MISVTRIFLLYIAVSLAVESDSDSTELKKTYVTSVEKSIQMLINSENKIQKNILTIKNNLKELTSGVFPKYENTTGKKSTISDILNPFKHKIKAIYPGMYY